MTQVTRIEGLLAALRAVKAHLMATFPEREEQIDGILAAMLSGEHVVLLGPPGTAKTAVAVEVSRIFKLRLYRTLLTKFTTPPEVFGPMSLKGIQNDEVRFQTARMLPEAEVAILDEVFKAGSALLNTLLTMINERLFINGTLGPQPAPIRTIIGASNELPEAGTDALWDRFLFRFEVPYVRTKQSFAAVMRSNLGQPAPVSVEKADLDTMMAATAAIPIPDTTIDALWECRGALATEGITVSDRRWKKALCACRAYAYMAAEPEVSGTTLLSMSHMLWAEPKQKGKIARTLAKILDSDVHTMCEIADAASETLKAFENSPKGVKESATFGKQLKAMQAKANALLQKAPEGRKAALSPMVNQIDQAWRHVIKLAAEAAGLTA